MKNKETLEDAAEKYASGKCNTKVMHKGLTDAIKFGAKLQQEKSYSEEEVLDLLLRAKIETVNLYYEEITEWFKQFKKK